MVPTNQFDPEGAAISVGRKHWLTGEISQKVKCMSETLDAFKTSTETVSCCDSLSTLADWVMARTCPLLAAGWIPSGDAAAPSAAAE